MNSRGLFRGALFLFLAFRVSYANCQTSGVYVPPFTDDGKAVLILHLDGNALDSSGCGNDGRIKGTVEWVPGKFGKAVKFNQQGVIVVRSSESLNVGEGSWTVECWFKPAEQKSAHAEVFSTSYPFLTGYGMRISYKRDLCAQFSAGKQTIATAKGLAKKLNDGKWHKAAIVLDREHGGMIRMYVDGKEVTDRRTFQPLPLGSSGGRMPFLLGGLHSYKTGGFIGLVDEVRVSNMVRKPYRLGKGGYPVTSGRVEKPKSSLVIRTGKEKAPALLTLKPENTIITYSPRDSFARKGALMLRKYLRLVRGAESGFEIVPVGKIGVTDDIVVALGRCGIAGEPDSSKLDTYGFIIKRVGKTVFVKGRKPIGAYLGAARFLEDFAGVRFYMPGDLFTYVPKGKTVEVGKVDMVENPYAVTCRAAPGGVPGGSEWGERLGLIRRNWVGSHQHTAWIVFNPERFASKYPGIYPVLKGRRYIPKNRRDQKWQPCFSEPKLVDAALEYAVQLFRRNPGVTHFAVSVMDCHNFCECPKCLAVVEAMKKKLASRFSPEERNGKKFERLARTYAYSYLNAKFLNELSDRLAPALAKYGINDEKTIAYIAYSDVRIAPSEFGLKLRPNILPVMVFKYSDVLIDKRFEPGRDGMDYFKRWSTCASQLGSHDWAFGNGFYIPRFYTKLVSKTLSYWKRLGVRFGYAYAEMSPHWGLDGPKYYMMAKTWWNPDVDIDNLWHEYCRDLFGDAAKPMYDYFMLLEDLFVNDMNPRIEQKIFRFTRSFNECSDTERAKFAKCRKLLDEALAKSGAGKEIKRIEVFSKTFKLTEMLLDLSKSDSADLERKSGEILEYAEKTLMPDPLTLFGAGGRHRSSAMATLKQAVRQIASKRKRDIGKQGGKRK